MSWRNLFFAPGNRPDLLGKFERVQADNFVIDLEDGTPPDHKQAAREALADNVAMIRAKPLSGRLLVRINAIGTPGAEADLQAALATPIDGIVLPKIEKASDLAWIDAEAGRAARTDIIVVGGVESLTGILDIRDFTREPGRLVALYFGPEDIAAQAGMERTAESDEVLYARQRVLLAAKAAGIGAIDQAVVNIHDAEAFERDCARARRWGFDGKICLNPRQAADACRFFTPAPEAIDRARRLLAAYADGAAQGRGTITFEGGMIDQPMVIRARAILAAAGEPG
ncbi:CoA ester lyase [Sphingomonas sp. AOB5]|uniref:HpcH/HpaI aldolase/citrate lyase family protein n=1 Tax=Sphingomonas sp. AOB5 TaxID=3034017 RepID=UPI0023F85F0E|nr:CoA ester lyase [Sphingomonas sp. AOB5]MDF7774826.1 CoA ester lyase [Sphingomonas sp. AOB5]